MLRLRLAWRKRPRGRCSFFFRLRCFDRVVIMMLRETRTWTRPGLRAGRPVVGGGRRVCACACACIRRWRCARSGERPARHSESDEAAAGFGVRPGECPGGPRRRVAHGQRARRGPSRRHQAPPLPSHRLLSPPPITVD